MFPFRTSSIFRSRWMALLWAGGILWTAIDVAGSPPTGGDNQTTDASGEQMKQTEKLLEDLGK
jgi:hypothetical protein